MNRYTLSQHTQRWRRALRYALNRMTPADADLIGYECQSISGVWSLETISAESVRDYALNLWTDHPALEKYADEAAARVASKWDGTGDVRCAAEEWAINLIDEYAKSDGVELVEA